MVRNVLFITADQLRADTLGCYGHRLVQTPCLDQLAADGAQFVSHYTQSTPCGPARAGLHTGMYPMNHRVVDNGTPLDFRHTNWAHEIRSAKPHLDPRLIGYVDQTTDPRELDGPEDHRGTHWDGGYLRGLRRLTDTDDRMGTLPWLRANLDLHPKDPLL